MDNAYLLLGTLKRVSHVDVDLQWVSAQRSISIAFCVVILGQYFYFFHE